jgi:TetR/AcrR family transcriptional regulator
MITVRERNPHRSRERLLAAGLSEFAAKGFAGARVESIARRTGLNKQLISHYFGGKRGLYRAVMSRRRNAGGGEISIEPGPMPDALGVFHDLARQDPEWIRVLLWETLERDEVGVGGETGGESGGAGPAEGESDGADGADDAGAVDGLADRVARYRERVGWIRAEQAAGHLPDDLDPQLLFLSLMGAALYPVLLPGVAELVCGEDPRSDEFAERYRAHLGRLAAHLVP